MFAKYFSVSGANVYSPVMLFTTIMGAHFFNSAHKIKMNECEYLYKNYLMFLYQIIVVTAESTTQNQNGQDAILY